MKDILKKLWLFLLLTQLGIFSLPVSAMENELDSTIWTNLEKEVLDALHLGNITNSTNDDENQNLLRNYHSLKNAKVTAFGTLLQRFIQQRSIESSTDILSFLIAYHQAMSTMSRLTYSTAYVAQLRADGQQNIGSFLEKQFKKEFLDVHVFLSGSETDGDDTLSDSSSSEWDLEVFTGREAYANSIGSLSADFHAWSNAENVIVTAMATILKGSKLVRSTRRPISKFDSHFERDSPFDFASTDASEALKVLLDIQPHVGRSVEKIANQLNPHVTAAQRFAIADLLVCYFVTSTQAFEKRLESAYRKARRHMVVRPRETKIAALMKQSLITEELSTNFYARALAMALSSLE